MSLRFLMKFPKAPPMNHRKPYHTSATTVMLGSELGDI